MNWLMISAIVFLTLYSIGLGLALAATYDKLTQEREARRQAVSLANHLYGRYVLKRQDDDDDTAGQRDTLPKLRAFDESRLFNTIQRWRKH